MKTTSAILFVFLSSFLFGQTEQTSLNFFADNLLPKIKKKKIIYDGKINDKTHYEEPKLSNNDDTIIEIILFDYYLNKRKGLSKEKTEFSKDFDFSKTIKYANVKNASQGTLKIPKSIKFKSQLITKKRKAGRLRYKINNLFPQKYNLRVSPSIQIEENTYLTRIFLTKQDYEKGSNFDIIVKNGNVIDWTETGWIQ